MSTTSTYVLDRRLDPSLRDELDLSRLSAAEAKRERRRLRNVNVQGQGKRQKTSETV